MPKANSQSKVLIIDCGIAHAAGPEDAKHPTSKHCRDFLLAVRSICHRIGMSESVAAEWKRHRSGFSRRWLRSMEAKKKVIRLPSSEVALLRGSLDQSATSDNGRDAMAKDAHLLEAALGADQRIASLDETVRALFSDAATNVRQLRGIIWINPDTEFEASMDWLQRGAPLDKDLQLSSSRKPLAATTLPKKKRQS